MQERRIRAFMRAAAMLMAAGGLLVFAGSAFANAPNPIPGSAKVDSVSVSGGGAYTITVEGRWDWVTQTDCPTARDGVGYNVAWFDSSDTANAIGSGKSPNGVIYVGTATDNIVHSIYTNGGPSGTLVSSANPFYDGVPTSYLSHNTTSSTPTSADAKNWVSNCNNEDPATKISSGQWGPISHTYPAGDNGPFVFCPVMYDPHGSGTAAGGKIGSSSVGDLTAGGGGHNNDNSYEGNGTGANGNNCQQLTIPQLSTSAQPQSGTLGQTFHDNATLSSSTGSGTITWNLYQAGAGCSGPPLFTDSLNVNGDGTYTDPTGFVPTNVGTYQWQASYSSSVISKLSTQCNDPAEQFTVVQPPQPSITTNASPSTGSLGGSMTDTATLSGGTNPTGTITWKLYSDSGCTKVVDSVSATVNGNGVYTTSPAYTPTATGTYHWVANYSGDANNQPVSTLCSDASEQTTIPPNPPTIVTNATPKVGSLGSTIVDQATLSGGFNPTGTITWSLYSDSACTNLVDTVTATVNGNGAYTTSPGYTPTATGTYHWVAAYSGDANNQPATTLCSDSSEQTRIPPPQPSIVTNATSSAVLGGVIRDTATLSGGSSPTGTITWSLYNDKGCTNLVDTISVSVNGNGTYAASPGYTASSPGAYYWVAKYSGDANNNSATTRCGDPSEITLVNSPGIKVVKTDSVPCADLATSVAQPPDVSCAGTFTTFTHNIVTLQVPRTGNYAIPIDYQIEVTNTGQTTLDLPISAQLDDPMCDSGTVVGPTANGGTLGFSSRTGQDTVLSAGGKAIYTCSHTLTQNDASGGSGDSFTNTVSVTAYPPSGPPVHGSDLVTVHRTQPPPPQPFCIARRGKHKGQKINWPKHTPKPLVCRPVHHPHPKPPKKPSGFTG